MGCLQGQGLNEEKGVPSEQIHPWESDFYDPDFFDAAAGDAPIDTNLDWYSDKIGVASTSVLDLGCGTGRFTLSLLGKGHRVIAVDRSEKMLARLKQKCAGLTAEARRRLSIVHADLATSGPTGRASFAIAPDDFLTHFLSITSLSAALESIRESLETGGKFLTDFRPRSERYLERAARGFPKPMKSFGTVPNALIDGKPRAIGTRAWEDFDKSTRILTTSQAFEIIKPDGILETTIFKTIRQRLHTHDELVSRGASAGFNAIARELNEHSLNFHAIYYSFGFV